MAISLALVGAAVTAQDNNDEVVEAGLGQIGSATYAARPQGAAEAQVPLRSAFLDATSQREEAQTPVMVRIPDIGLEASVLPVGVDEDNQFAVPEADTVGWYRYGAAPGDQGSAVLAAHVDYAGRAGAFFNLADLQPGEALEVVMADGSVLRYRVTDNVLYDKVGLPAEDLFRKDGDHVLTMITCGGTFDRSERSYNGNVVVTAEPIAA
jgi:LPXTG-site transpeptidase (sortase) family protein